MDRPAPWDAVAGPAAAGWCAPWNPRSGARPTGHTPRGQSPRGQSLRDTLAAHPPAGGPLAKQWGAWDVCHLPRRGVAPGETHTKTHLCVWYLSDVRTVCLLKLRCEAPQKKQTPIVSQTCEHWWSGGLTVNCDCLAPGCVTMAYIHRYI